MKFPLGKVHNPKSIVPHGLLAQHFSKLALLHAAAAGANAPDSAISRLPRPDKVVSDLQSGGYLGRKPVIGNIP